MKRVKWTIAYDKKVRAWRAGPQVGWYRRNKRALINVISEHLRDRWKLYGELSELIIKKKDGRIQDRRTYGKDPRKTKG